MKKVYLLSFAFFILFLVSGIRAQNFQWANKAGLYKYDYGYGICTDNTGNVYVAGKYEDTANFSGITVPCQGNHDIYLAQYTSTGTLNWIRTAGGLLGDYAESVSTDGSNYLYIAGEIEGYNQLVTFVGTNTTLTSVGSNDIFLAKYDLSGNLQWANRAGGVFNEKALGVTNDNAGNVYICGFFNDSATFGGTTVHGSGLNDIYVAKYDANGNFVWVRNAGGSGRDEAKSVKCDALGNVYICGLFSGTATFGQLTFNSHGYFDAFVAKYSPNGTLKWVKASGGTWDDVAWSMTMGNLGKLYVSGEFNASVLFDNIQLNTTGDADVYVACYDTLGTVQWASKAGGNLTDRARGIGSDGTNIYITGQFGGSATFGANTLSAADSSDIFMAALNSSGNFLWATSVGGTPDAHEPLGYESGNAICGDVSGNVYATGATLDGGVFGNTTLTALSRTDVFITKITQGPDISPPIAVIYTPSDNANAVPKGTNLILTFNEAVQKGAGSILIKENGIVTQTIPVSGANVTVSGNAVTIDPADFTDSAHVSVTMAPGVFMDMTNNAYTGISSDTTWNFTIAKPGAIPTYTEGGKVIIYPNPGNGIFTCILDKTTGQKIEVVVYNCIGEMIKNNSCSYSSPVQMDMTGCEKGIYFVQVKVDNVVYREKLILQ